MTQFTNQAHLSYNDSVINSNVAVGEILEVLSATKTAVTCEYSRDDKVTYIINIINSGNKALNGITITDNLGAYSFFSSTLYPLTFLECSVQFFINGILQADPQTQADPPFTFSGICIPAKSNATIIYEAKVNKFAPACTSGYIANEATITGPCIINPIIIDETIYPEKAADLTITKFIDPVPVTENGRLTYTFIIQNFGNTDADADDNVTLRDVFDPKLSNIAVKFNGTAWCQGTNFNYNASTGVLETVPGEITVPAATCTQDPNTGVWSVNPGVSELVVSGSIAVGGSVDPCCGTCGETCDSCGLNENCTQIARNGR